MYMFYIMFSYSLSAAILLQLIYDMLILTIRQAEANLQRIYRAASGPAPTKAHMPKGAALKEEREAINQRLLFLFSFLRTL